MTEPLRLVPSEPVTDPARSHRVVVKTAAGDLYTRAMSEPDAYDITLQLKNFSHGTGHPLMRLPLPGEEWDFNARHAIAWRIIQNIAPTIP